MEDVAQQVVHPAQHGFVCGRRMGDNIMLTLSALEKALILGESTYGTTLFDIAAAFPSVDRQWVWAILAGLGLPD